MIHSMNIGDQREYTRIITEKDVLQFAEVTKDFNPAHFDEEYTKNTIFKKPIVHGMLVGSLFSKIFGLDYPGEGTIYISQNLKFLKPVYPNTSLIVRTTVKEIILERNRVIFTTEIFDRDQNCLLTGEAVLMPKKEPQHG